MAKLLIADDSTMMRETLSTILSESGHTVSAQACNGYEACLEFDKHLPDLLLLDFNMPVINGIEALQAILSKHPHAKVIMLSSETCSSLISHALKLGAKDYIIKPFSIQHLLVSIGKVLQCNEAVSNDAVQCIYSKINTL